MANRKIRKTKSLQAKSKKKYGAKIKQLQQDAAVNCQKPMEEENFPITEETSLPSVMLETHDNAALKEDVVTNSDKQDPPLLDGNKVSASKKLVQKPMEEENCPIAEETPLPSVTFGTLNDAAPNEENAMDSDQNNKQGPSLLNDNNVSASKKPVQQSTQVVNLPISEDASALHLQLATDQDILMLENSKESIIQDRQQTQIRHLSDISLNKNQTLNHKDTDVDHVQQVSPQVTVGKVLTKTDIALDGSIRPSNKLNSDEKEHYQNNSPVVQHLSSDSRPATPNKPIPVTEIFSPNTVNEFRSTIRALFPNGPPPPRPVIPVKRRQKGDQPYIVGCTKRRRIPEKKTLSVFQGDKKYGVTEETNSFNDEECPAKRKRGKRNQTGNWSKSRFNPRSEEIAARLQMNEKVDELLRKSPGKESFSYMSKPYAPRPQAFSPLPSTSKDNETIMKNEKHFNESLNYDNNNFDCDDDDELPEIKWESDKSIKNNTHQSLLQNKEIETINQYVPSVKYEDMNNNNNNDIETNDVDFHEIQFDKYMPKKKYNVPTETNTTDAHPIVIDDNIEVNEPKRVLNKKKEIIDTLEIKDDYSSITYEDLYSVPKSTEVVDVDEFLKEMQAYKQKSRKIHNDIITIVDPTILGASHNNASPVKPVSTQVSHNEKLAVNLVPIQTEDNQETDGNLVPTHKPLKDNTTSTTIETTEVIEIPDFVEPVDNLSNQASTSKANKTYSWNNEVEFVSETTNEQNSRSNDIETVVNGFFNGRRSGFNLTNEEPNQEPRISTVAHDLQMLFSFLTESCGRYMQPKQRRKKPKKSQSPKKPKEQLQQQPGTVNNENAAPSTNTQVQAPPTNGERKLGDCPICMENLSTNAIASTTCGHVFCLDCIKKCLRNSGKKCPTCRKTLKGTGYHPVFL